MAAIGVAALHALIGYALITALAIELPARARPNLKLFEITSEPPPLRAEPPVPRQASARKRRDAAAPPNLKAKPPPIVAPPPPVPLIIPPPLVAAPVAGLDGDRSAGASDRPGPGTGSAGQGTGSGGGGAGDGDGDGDYTAPRWLRGRLRDADFPRAAGEAGLGRRMTLRFTVEANGRVTGCTVLQSSGSPMVDDATCRAIERRYRYEPSRDARDRAVPSLVVEEHRWTIHGR